MTVDRIPPNNLEAEMAVLGSVLVDRASLDVVDGLVRADDFYALIHETIFAEMLALALAGKPIDKITLAARLRDRGHLELVGGLPYLNSLMDTVPTAASATHYATIVREKAQLRALIHAGSEIARSGFEGEHDVQQAISDATTVLRAATERGEATTGGTSLVVALRARYESLTNLAYGVAVDDSQKTLWAGVNALVGGFRPGELVVWPSAPKMGKSAALVMLADFVSAHYGAVAMFALEMGVDASAMRLLALHSSISARAQRAGELSDADLERIAAAQAAIADRPITFFDLSYSRLADMRRELHVLAKTAPIAAVILDHVNFLTDVDGARGDRTTKHERLDRVYRELLRIAKEFGCVVHAVQHVSREGMRSRPTLADIRDGGNPEGHAHAVIFPYRPNPTGSLQERKEGEFIVAAVREGDAGIVPMRFFGHRGMWLERDESCPWFEVSEPIARTRSHQN